MIDGSDSGESEIFRKELEALLGQFERARQGQLTSRTLRRHATVVQALIDFLCCDCGVGSFAAVRRSMVCSRFRQWYCTNMQDRTETQVNTVVKTFFAFLVFEKGIVIGKDVFTGLKLKPPPS